MRLSLADSVRAVVLFVVSSMTRRSNGWMSPVWSLKASKIFLSSHTLMLKTIPGETTLYSVVRAPRIALAPWNPPTRLNECIRRCGRAELPGAPKLSVSISFLAGAPRPPRPASAEPEVHPESSVRSTMNGTRTPLLFTPPPACGPPPNCMSDAAAAAASCSGLSTAPAVPMVWAIGIGARAIASTDAPKRCSVGSSDGCPRRRSRVRAAVSQAPAKAVAFAASCAGSPLDTTSWLEAEEVIIIGLVRKKQGKRRCS